jgi:hypothetical protein
MGKAMQGLLIARIAPPDGEEMLFLAFQEGRRHRGSDELPSDTSQLRHNRLLLSCLSTYAPSGNRISPPVVALNERDLAGSTY